MPVRLLLALTMTLVLLASVRATERRTFDQITLTTGEVIKQPTVMSETPTAITVRVGKTIRQIEKRLLPADVAKLYPADPDAASAREAAAREAKEANDARVAQQQAATKKQIAENAAKLAASEQELATAAQRNEEQKKIHVRDGLMLESVNASLSSAYLTLHNVSEATQKFEWHGLSARLRDGSAAEVVSAMAPAPNQADFTIEAGQTKIFQVAFRPKNRPVSYYTKWLDMVSWAPGVWLRSGWESATVDPR